MLGGAAAANPAVGGGLGALSGFATIMGEIPTDEAEMPDLAATEAGLQAGINDVCESMRGSIMNTLKAVMGVPGSSEADIPWEMKMKDGEDTGYVHAISYLFGNGQWLLDHPTDGLEEVFSDLEIHMVEKLNHGRSHADGLLTAFQKQSLAWQLLRLQHHAVMVINDASSCEDVNELKDDENGYCKQRIHLSATTRLTNRRLRPDVPQR